MLERHETRPPLMSRSDLAPLSLLMLAGMAILAIYGSYVGFNELHVLGLEKTLNDQANYITSAKRFLGGHLESGMLFPATVAQEFERNYLYMPGHALLTGLSFSVFGINTFAAFLPNILGYLFCAGAIYTLGKRFYSVGAGIGAALVFMLFPLSIVYALSAMSEMTFLAATLAAALVFYNVPARSMPWAAPLCLMLPFFFRESAILLAVPFAIYLYAFVANYQLRKAIIPAAALLLACFVMLLALMSIDAIGSRPNLGLNTLVLGNTVDKYTNAAVDHLIPANLHDWLSLALTRGVQNLQSLLFLIVKDPTSLQAFSLLFILLTAAASPIIAWKNTEARGVALQVAGLSLIIIFCLTFLYNWTTFIGIRQLLLVLPLQAIMIAILLCQLQRTSKVMGIAASAAAVLVFAHYSDVSVDMVTARDQKQARLESMIDDLEILDGTVIMGDADIAVVYGLRQQNGYITVIPHNTETLDLLNERFPVTGAIIPEKLIQNSERLRSMLDSLSLEYVETIALNETVRFAFHTLEKEDPDDNMLSLEGHPEANPTSQNTHDKKQEELPEPSDS